MYVPHHFVEDRVEVLHAAIREAGLATLVTTGAGEFGVSHIPMFLDPEPGPLGRLIGHVARANSQWKSTPDGSAALAIILGPNAYVSPSWYATKRESGRVVPTWDYVAVQAHGTVRFFDQRERLLDVVARLTDRHERGRAAPWKVGDAPPDYLDGLLKSIVGVELTLTRLEGQWKASQNKGEADRRGVEEGLRDGGNGALADLVRARGG
jgi:transcriptional regulator